MKKNKIVFFGSGPVAAESLKKLLDTFEIIAVVTKPKPKHHRGKIPVVDLSNDYKLPLFTVSNKDELSELIKQKPFVCDLAILIDFGIIVGQDTIDYFPKGIVNSHFSLLPQLRGADPISFAILEGLEKTGVSLMLLVEAMDEGPIITCGVHELSGKETTPELTGQLIQLSDALLKDAIPIYLKDGKTKDQSKLSAMIPDYPSETSYSRKLTKEDGILDFNKTAIQLEREIRAFIQWPKTRTRMAGTDVIITCAEVSNYRGKPGEITIIDNSLLLHSNQGSLDIKRLKPAGRKDMPIASFLAGYKDKLDIK